MLPEHIPASLDPNKFLTCYTCFAQRVLDEGFQTLDGMLVEKLSEQLPLMGTQLLQLTQRFLELDCAIDVAFWVKFIEDLFAKSEEANPGKAVQLEPVELALVNYHQQIQVCITNYRKAIEESQESLGSELRAIVERMLRMSSHDYDCVLPYSSWSTFSWTWKNMLVDTLNEQLGSIAGTRLLQLMRALHELVCNVRVANATMCAQYCVIEPKEASQDEVLQHRLQPVAMKLDDYHQYVLGSIKSFKRAIEELQECLGDSELQLQTKVMEVLCLAISYRWQLASYLNELNCAVSMPTTRTIKYATFEEFFALAQTP